ncbi:hypothetical protein BH708_13735 [Brachybacterium sp. P6-10-X1]|uniref:hypothetical protein n=1 Tax=Brachybacterium sp. P6-10-X1 TaxID=1903186 RepID=UPI000971A45D|nr:hypothetical protein [Brachybacterium sp. P6-10-X1]APX33597.1 hypothetical protein BH708_13735 [Brachybacterium sp. P6-10-X1]
MRTPVYLIAIASCLVLSWLFASRENWLGMGLVLVAAVVYGVRLVITSRADRTASAEAARGPKAATSAEQEQLKAELGEMREAYERSRRVMLLLTVIIAGLAAVAWPWNPALALALLIFSIPTLVLAWRRTTAIRKIDAGLSAAR